MKVGTPVFLICDADRQGTVRVKPCIVGSWGKQRIHLLDAVTGTPHEARLYTKHVNCYLNPYIIPVSEALDLYAAAVKIAEGYTELHRTHLNRIISSEDFEQQNHHYKLQIRAALAALHEPRVILNGEELKAGGVR